MNNPMRGRLCLWIALLCSIPFVSAEPSGVAATVDYQVLEQYIERRKEETRVPGLAFAVVNSEGVEHLMTSGKDSGGRDITSTTSFLWGSVSKPVTASAIMQQVETGNLALDRPIRDYLPAWAEAESPGLRSVTIRQLLDHTSGLPKGTGAIDWYEEREDSYGAAVQRLLSVEAKAPPGEQYAYASENYLLLGAVLEAVTGKAFNDYLREQVLIPLGVNDAIANPEQARDSLSPGFTYAFGRTVSAKSGYDPAGASYGYLGGSIKDLSRFAIAQLNDGEVGAHRILKETSVEQMQSPSGSEGYGLGWRIIEKFGPGGRTRAIWHGGAVPGFQTMVMLFPEADKGIVLLQNAYGFMQDAELAGTAFGAADILLGGDVPPVEVNNAEYVTTLGVALGLLSLVMIGVLWPLLMGKRSGRESPRRISTVLGMVAWGTFGALIIYVLAIWFPRVSGARLTQLPLWAWDIGWLVIALLIGALLLIGTWVVTGFRRLLPSANAE